VPLKILVADDSVTMRRIFEIAFAGEDAKVTTVDSGDTAIAMAGNLAPDIVFADTSMATDGYKVASAIRATAGLERTAVIVLASQKHPFDEARARAAGVDEHVVKPFDTQQLIDKLKRVMAQPRAVATRSAAHPAPAVAQPAPVQPAAAQPQRAAAPRSSTIAFERSTGMNPLQAAPAAPSAPPLRSAPAPRPAPAAAAPTAPFASAAPSHGAVASATAGDGDLARKLDGLGLTEQQLSAVLSLSREVIERVVWEVVPDLAETMIREEIQRLTR
jgi:CheY-like chemotaxis protein